MVLRVVPEELARVVSLADECSATVGSVSVEPGSGGDLGPGVLVAAAAAYAAAHSAVLAPARAVAAWGWVDECGAGWAGRVGGCGCYAGSWFSWWGQGSGCVLASVGGHCR